MLRSLLILMLPVLFFPALVAGCGDDEETKEEYEAKVQRELDKTDERIKEFESQSGEATGDAKRELEEQTAGLKDERAAVERKLEDLRASSDDEWKKLKPDID